MAVKNAITDTSIHQPDLVTLLDEMATAINALRADHNTLVAKMNLDAGITDTNYAVSTASTVSLNP